jgi:hypothetical protein
VDLRCKSERARRPHCVWTDGSAQLMAAIALVALVLLVLLIVVARKRKRELEQKRRVTFNPAIRTSSPPPPTMHTTADPR